jgi:dimethylaniline monooxygenase (N-oxide forming)
VEENDIGLYKNVFSPDLPPTIAFLGLIQPIGAIMPISEMQARWIAAVFKGDRGLPTAPQMKKNIADTQAAIRRRYLKRSRHTIQVDYESYMDEIAGEVGCVPNVLRHLE